MIESSMWKNLVVAVGTACLTAMVTVACSGEKNVCADRNVRCEDPLQCDPGDGLCKCGGRGGMVCADGFACDAEANTCISTLCAHVNCADKPGTSCDRLTGQCKCGGTGGKVCAEGESCNPNARTCVPAAHCSQVACPRNATCDAATGQCLCGAAACGPGETCGLDADGGAPTCAHDACFGVTCSGHTVCDPADGYCKCNGLICQGGESCSCPAGTDGGACADAARLCKPGTACTGVNCAAFNNNTTCDPVDGVCKCGGPGGQACGATQLCTLTPLPQCQGGQQCVLPDGGPKVCANGSSCDPEDGRCKCGGRGGVSCRAASADDAGVAVPAEVCVLNPLQQACRRPCDIRNPGDCPAGTYCYFDSSATTPAAYCAPNSDTQDEESGCTTPTACFTALPSPHGMHCNGLVLGQTGLCRPYCDVGVGHHRLHPGAPGRRSAPRSSARRPATGTASPADTTPEGGARGAGVGRRLPRCVAGWRRIDSRSQLPSSAAGEHHAQLLHA